MKVRLADFLLICGVLIGQKTICSESAEAIQIVSYNNHSFHVESEIVDKILGNAFIRNRQVAIFSIAGALRKGKSFFLNFAPKYLDAQYVKYDTSDWIGENKANVSKLHGFKTHGGQRPETTGIWMWSEVYTHDFDNGEKVAIILLDTQGIFDHESSMKDCTTIFAISTMLSSVQCYNVMQHVQEDNLQHLEYFTQYGKMALEQTHEKPFQKLIFLIRDWPYAKEIGYGYAPKYVEKLLAGNDNRTAEMRQLRDGIISSFSEINAFLMPYPGSAVAEGENINGLLSQIDTKFIKYVKEIVPSLFAPENLIIKKINGKKLHAGEFLTYLATYIKLFKGNELPEPKTAFMATAEATIVVLYRDCLNLYVEAMRKAMDRRSYFSPSDLLEIHGNAKDDSLLQFQNKRKFGGHELVSSYKTLLEEEIAKLYRSFERENEKNKESHNLRKAFDERTLSDKKGKIGVDSGVRAIIGGRSGPSFGPVGSIVALVAGLMTKLLF